MTAGIFLATISVYFAAWVLNLGRLIYQKGLDPSLATYADPLSLGKLAGWRIVSLLTVLMRGFGIAYSGAAGDILILGAAFHLIVLFAFQRQRTQPYGYYFSALLIGLSAFVGGYIGLAGGLTLICGQELYLLYWQKNSRQIYNRWVADCTKEIHERYGELISHLRPAERKWVLHLAATESIARPRIVRIAERFYYYLKRPQLISTGIMQIQHHGPVSDSESIRLGAKLISELLAKMPRGLSAAEQMAWMSQSYNGSQRYQALLLATQDGVEQSCSEISSLSSSSGLNTNALPSGGA